MRSLELRIPPPVIMLVTALLMWLLSAAVPAPMIGFAGNRVVAGLLVVVGLATGAVAVLSFRKAGTTIHPTKPDTSACLVTSGIYRRTRNPMYLGLLVILLGWAALLANIAALMSLPLFVGYINRFQIGPEERALAGKFPAEFDAYRQRVRRWL
ncbi:MAG: isoprenylcysteine carboxylmethyltransferase family protein [Nitrococcus sp.]|nr:isoprenylcysteine carboxylmethyltransferase family protein [Nitrococcus sp.]